MRKTLTVIGASLFASHAFADSITDGIGTAGDAIYSYTPYVQALGYVLASIIGIVAAFVIYYAIANNDRNVKKRILTWGGGCVAMLCMTIALPSSSTIRSRACLQETRTLREVPLGTLQVETVGEK